jgi:hypothetical protein
LVVRGLLLPRELVDLIEAGQWKCPTDPSGLDRLFPERSEFCCYTYAGMASESSWLDRDRTPMWQGTPDLLHPPGDIDSKKTIFIADLGIGYDQPIALDYRSSLNQPRVLTFRWDLPAPPIPWKHVKDWIDGKRKYDAAKTERLEAWSETTRMGRRNRWVEIAPDFATFAELIGL